jgi:hypothetical protein
LSQKGAKKARRAGRDDLECAPGGTPSVIAYGDATFPKGTALGVAAKFPTTTKGVPLGELASAARLRGYFARKKARRAGGLWERISPQHFEGRIFHP